MRTFKVGDQVKFSEFFTKLDYDGNPLAGRKAEVTWVRGRGQSSMYPYKVSTISGGITDLPVTENEIQAV